MPRSSGSAVPSSIDLVVFDCDGVLVDSEVLACRAVADTLAAFDYAVGVESIADRFIGVSNRDMYAALAVDTGGTLPEGFDAAMKRRALDLFERELNAIAGLDTVLPRLAIAKCVASSSLPDDIVWKLRRTDLLRWFQPAAIFSTALVARGKPAPDIFLYAAEKMGTSPGRSIAVEDSAPGVAAAKAAGMATFGFTGGSHCRPGHEARLKSAGADLVFTDMRELPGLIAARSGGQRNATLTTS
jgi:HAD superfamily hydrolase (TIGR01509 family)